MNRLPPTVSPFHRSPVPPPITNLPIAHRLFLSRHVQRLYARLEDAGLSARIAAVNSLLACPGVEGEQRSPSARVGGAAGPWQAAKAATVGLGPTEDLSRRVNFSFALQYFGGGAGAERRLSDTVLPLLTRLHWAASEADLTAEVFTPPCPVRRAALHPWV